MRRRLPRFASLLGRSRGRRPRRRSRLGIPQDARACRGDRPLAVVFDDIHWGEETFLDLVEHVALLSSGSPLLLLCLARPELSERRPTWPISLAPRAAAHPEVERLIPETLDESLRERIARAAGGNPLFIGEMLAMAGRRRGGRPADAAGAPGGPARPARGARAGRARVRGRRGRDLPPRRRPGARPGRAAGDATARRPGPQGAGRTRAARLPARTASAFATCSSATPRTTRCRRPVGPTARTVRSGSKRAPCLPSSTSCSATTSSRRCAFGWSSGRARRTGSPTRPGAPHRRRPPFPARFDFGGAAGFLERAADLFRRGARPWLEIDLIEALS